MNERVKYPLTEAAKEAARRLVQAWDDGEIEQIEDIVGFPKTINGRKQTILIVNEMQFGFGTLHELDRFGLIDLSTHNARKILLLQELRNAVDNDFAVSDYFLTMNAVGTIVHGNIELRDNSSYQSNALGANIYNSGTLIAQELESMLGDEVLKDAQLKQAIDALRDSDGEPKETRLQKMKNVLDELGRCMQHTANAVQIASGLGFVANVIQALGG